MRICGFSPVRLEPSALRLTLRAIKAMMNRDRRLQWAFYDDNEDPESSDLLRDYCESSDRVFILKQIETLPRSSHARCAESRGWDRSTVDRIICIKNSALRFAVEEGFDAVVLLDADLLPHPEWIETLLGTGHVIVAGVFWTQFSKGKPLMPNCWDVQTYVFRNAESVLRLRQPGVYEVGGLGAATLIRAEALRRGLTFDRIPNLDMWGEDKHFCVRAACLGFQLFVETTFPLFHMYAPEDVAEGARWLERGCLREDIVCRLDSQWEQAVRRLVEKPEMRGVRLVRRKIGSALRMVANRVDPR